LPELHQKLAIHSSATSIRERTYSDTNASLDGKAVLGDSLVVGSLSSKLLWGNWQWHTDVELGNSDINLEVIGPGLPGSLHSLSIEVAEDEVALSTDTVDWDTLLLELADKGSDGLGLWSITLEVVLGKSKLEADHNWSGRKMELTSVM
jgi:hypothetical protein